MASTYSCYSLSLSPIPNSPNLNKTQLFSTRHYTPSPFSSSISKPWSPGIRATNSSSPSTAVEEALKASQEAMSIENLQSFININLGKWNGSFFGYFRKGCILEAMEQYDDALAAFQTALQYNPKSVEVSRKMKKISRLARDKKRAEEVEKMRSNVDLAKHLDELKSEMSGKCGSEE